MACRSPFHSELQRALAMPACRHSLHLSRSIRRLASKRRRDRLRVHRRRRLLQPVLEATDLPGLSLWVLEHLHQRLRLHPRRQKSWHWHKMWRSWRRTTPGQRSERTPQRGGGIIEANSSTIEAEERVHNSKSRASVGVETCHGSCCKVRCCTWHSSGMLLAEPLVQMAHRPSRCLFA